MFLQHFVPSWKKCPLLVEMVVRLKNNINNATQTNLCRTNLLENVFSSIFDLFEKIHFLAFQDLFTFCLKVRFLFLSENIVSNFLSECSVSLRPDCASLRSVDVRCPFSGDGRNSESPGQQPLRHHRRSVGPGLEPETAGCESSLFWSTVGALNHFQSITAKSNVV